MSVNQCWTKPKKNPPLKSLRCTLKDYVFIKTLFLSEQARAFKSMLKEFNLELIWLDAGGVFYSILRGFSEETCKRLFFCLSDFFSFPPLVASLRRRAREYFVFLIQCFFLTFDIPVSILKIFNPSLWDFSFFPTLFLLLFGLFFVVGHSYGGASLDMWGERWERWQRLETCLSRHVRWEMREMTKIWDMSL